MCELERKSSSRIAESRCRGFQGNDCRGLLKCAAEEQERKSRSRVAESPSRVAGGFRGSFAGVF